MKRTKQLGIWMDHSIAHIMELKNGKIVTTTINAQVGEQDEALNTLNENMIQNKEQNELLVFFKRLSEVIKGNDDVLLFGPTNAKTELFNVLKADRHFEKIKFGVKSADNMTENQQLAFVKDYFNTSSN